MMKINPHEVLKKMPEAFAKEQFVVFYQPQYNHTTGTLLGAEALVRWFSPEMGIVLPENFIPVMEDFKQITALDFYVFERVCQFLRRRMDAGLPLIRISVNLSHYDLMNASFVDEFENVRKQYEVPAEFIHVEITEISAKMGIDQLRSEVDKFHAYGYKVQLDDFGCGYSSLNVLKKVPFDMLKLDMSFLSEGSDSSRGNIIFESMVRMAKWLKLPVIAERVETAEQADFLQTIGCDLIQGFLYSPSLPMDGFERLLEHCDVSSVTSFASAMDKIDSNGTWSPDSMDALVFNNFVGAAAIIEFRNGKCEIIRMNRKYQNEVSQSMDERELLATDPLTLMDKFGQGQYLETLNRAIRSRTEEECETWRVYCSDLCGSDKVCIRSTIRMIGENGGRTLFYVLVRNISSEKTLLYDTVEQGIRLGIDDKRANGYFWEYFVATKEMHPCYRCQRDLNLPSVIRNYPEPVIASGLFPPEYAEMYRDWHRQIAEGVPELDAVIPLTEARVPFRVHYTTEFDEQGRPVRARAMALPILE